MFLFENVWKLKVNNFIIVIEIVYVIFLLEYCKGKKNLVFINVFCK